MHAQIVQFTLTDMTDEGYREACRQLAPAFAGLPGLLAKLWLADPAANAYGGVYLWRDRESMRGYLDSELFRTVSAIPNFAGFASRDLPVDEELTRTTRPGIRVLEPAGAATPA
jgi:hypothetical protein